MHKLLIAATFILLSFIASSQQNNIWYFGRNAAIDFNASLTGPVPTVLSNSAMIASEGSASICDNNGSLLFYMNGTMIYNRDHQVMANGDGLLGHISAVQSSMIVPQPGNSNIYYVFTTDAIENDFENGYRYSIVDMTQAGGLGAVTVKNAVLYSSCTERMTAARHTDGVSVWLITNDYNSNIFRSWLISCAGLSTTPVVSTVGEVMDQHIFANTGMMKVSPDGKLLSQTHFASIGVGTQNFMQLFDFDNFTGQISNPRKLSITAVQIIASEFSPDSRLLYLSSAYTKEIYQLEAKLPTVADIINSRVRIPTPLGGFYGIQLAPDGKIYLAQTGGYLGAINKPNVKGLGCNYVLEQVDLAPGSAILGLPAYINDLSGSPANGFDHAIIDSCTGNVQFTGFSTLSGTLTWNWDFGDGGSSNLQNPQHAYSNSTQTYTVKLRITSNTGCGFIERSAIIYPGGIVSDPQFSFVSKCDSGYVRFTNESIVFPDPSLVEVLWDFGDGNTSTDMNPIHSYALGGNYNVKLTLKTTTPCLDRFIIQPVDLDLLDIQAPPDITVDANQPVQLFVTGGGDTFVWSPVTGLSDPAISNPIALPPKSMWYKVTARNEAGCVDSDSVFITVNPMPGIYVPSGFTPNNDGKNDVFRPILTKEFSLQEFSIYNRWGEKVFSTSEKGAGWNGKYKGLVQDNGVYVWILRGTDTRNGQKHEMKGTFVILH